MFYCSEKDIIIKNKKRGGFFLNNAELYIEKYKELEVAVRERFSLQEWDSVSYYLSKREEFRFYRDEIKYCQEVRNLLQHRQTIGGEYPVEPSKEMLGFLENTINAVLNRKTCAEIMVPLKTAVCCRISEKVLDRIDEIGLSTHSHVPVLNGKNVVGVFTPTSFLNYMVDCRQKPDPNITFGKLEKYIHFVDELKDMFEDFYSSGKRLCMAFVTENGKGDGDLLGIISPWDILGKDTE